jgi:predicted ATPase
VQRSSNDVPRALSAGRWQVQLLGAVRARNGDLEVTKFLKGEAALLARLAMQPGRDHPREELADLLWPAVPPAKARNSLRNALSMLRALLDTPDLPSALVIQADRRCVRLNASLVDCDVLAFERALRDGRRDVARRHYRGDLMPGFYDDWIEEERLRLAVLAEGAADTLAPPAWPVRGQPPPATPDRRVPEHPGSFVDRHDELAQLRALLARSRCITITGSAGCGKTRLAIELAARADGFDVAAWVPLASCDAPSAEAERVVSALGLRASRESPPLQQLADALEGRRVLLVLDNVEQLVERGAAHFAALLLDHVPGLTLVLTSQRAVRQPRGEPFDLAPWDVPAQTAGVAEARRNAAVQLFEQRAREHRADFKVHARNVHDIVALCRALDGVPLAIELAAARVRQFPPAELARLLAAGAPSPGPGARRRGTAARHASMDHAIGWSWQLLPPALRRTLVLLATFRTEFDVADAAELTGQPIGRCRTALDRLADASLLQRRPGDNGGRRYGVLSLVAAHALRAVGAEAAAAARARHRAWCLDRARRLAGESILLASAALPDYLHAIDTALADGDVPAAATLALALRAQWTSHGAGAQALSLLERVADAAALPAPVVDAPAMPAPSAGAPVSPAALQCEVACLLAQLLLEAGRADEAETLAAGTVRRAEALRPRAPRAVADAHLTAAHVRTRRDAADPTTPAAARHALALARRCGDPALVARASMLVGSIVFAQRHGAAEAGSWFARAEQAYARAGDPRGALTVLPGRVACLIRSGHRDEAIALARRGTDEARALRDVQTELLLLNRLGECLAVGRRHAEAAEACRRQVRLAGEHALVRHAAFALWNECYSLARVRRPAEAARLMAFVQRDWGERFGALAPEDLRYVAKVRRLVARQVGAARLDALWAQGLALTLREALELGGA